MNDIIKKIEAEQLKAEVPAFNVGDTVNHKAFGMGKIVKKTPMGGDALVEIEFESVGTKRLMLKGAAANMEKAYFAGGCFWCITPTFREMEGVTSVTSGYSGGREENPVYEERPSRAQKAYIDSVVMGVASRVDELNEYISKFAIGWDISRISRLARTVMQLAIFEILYVEDVPTGAAISEAVRIVKLYDGEDAGAFVNGILGSFYRSLANEVDG